MAETPGSLSAGSFDSHVETEDVFRPDDIDLREAAHVQDPQVFPQREWAVLPNGGLHNPTDLLVIELPL